MAKVCKISDECSLPSLRGNALECMTASTSTAIKTTIFAIASSTLQSCCHHGGCAEFDALEQECCGHVLCNRMTEKCDWPPFFRFGSCKPIGTIATTTTTIIVTATTTTTVIPTTSPQLFKSDGIDIQERCYDESVWVSTASTGPHTGSTSFRSMFKKLFNYISGENDQKKKVPMTAPVLVQVSLDKNIKDTLDIKMNFFAPPETVETLPNPSASDVKISSLPKMCVYVYSYGGWQSSVNKSMKKRVYKLRNALKKAGLEGQYDKESMIFAGYDSPWRLLKRHNEVMVRKIETEEPVIKQQ